MKKLSFLRLACFSVFTLLSLCLALKVNAATLSSYNHYYSNEYNGICGTSNKYTYSMIDSMGNWTYNSGTIGTTYNGKANAFWFDFTYDLTANTYYDIVINAPTNDFTQSITSSIVNVGNGTSCGDNTLSNISLVSVTKGASSGQYKKLTIRIYSATAVDYWTISIENDSAITGVSTFGISSLSITEVDLSGTDIIVDNNNSNTDSIINNNNQNTQDIIDNQNQNNQTIIDNQNQNNEELKDTINDNFNSCYTNIFNASSYISNTFDSVSITDNNITATANSSWKTLTYSFNVDTDKQYTLYYESTDDTAVYYYNHDTNDYYLLKSATFLTINPLISTLTIRLQTKSSGTVHFNKLMLVEGTTATFIPYGKEVCTNKLDEQVETSKGILGTLKSVFTSIVELPKKIVDFLVDALKSLFVPDSEELNQLMDSFKATISEKLGVIYQAGDLIISIFQNIIDDNSVENACLTFPELEIPNVNQPIIEETDFCFNTITDEIPILLTTIRGLSGVFITIMFINMLKKKYDDFINGGDL